MSQNNPGRTVGGGPAYGPVHIETSDADINGARQQPFSYARALCCRNINDRQRRMWMRGFCLYECAIAAFSVTVILAFGGPFLSSIAKQVCEPVEARDDDDMNCKVYLGQLPIEKDSLYPYTISLSVLIQVFTMPPLSSMADLYGWGRPLLVLCTVTGGVVTMALGAISSKSGQWALAAALFCFANVMCGLCTVLFNSFLPRIAHKNQSDSLSSLAMAAGFGTGFALLLINFGVYAGVSEDTGNRINLVIAGFVWIVLGLPAIAMLPEGDRTLDPTHNRKAPVQYQTHESKIGTDANQSSTECRCGLPHFISTLLQLPKLPELGLYILSNMFSSDAMWTIGSVLTTFGTEELEMSTLELGLALLLMQVVGLAGAFVFIWVAEAITAKWAIALTLVVYTLLCVYALFAFTTKPEFYVVSSVGFFVLGGCSSLSRSLFSQMIPVGFEAEFFTVYEITDRGTAWLGPLVFGLVNQSTGSMHKALGALVGLFVVGLGFLVFVDPEKGQAEALAFVKVESEVDSEACKLTKAPRSS